MYGYVVPEKISLSASDYVLYRAFYCGLCKSSGRQFGQLSRFGTNYDMTFFSVFLHDAASFDVKIEAERCICNPHKKAIIKDSRLLDDIAAANLIMLYYKAEDGIRDGDGSKAIKFFLKKPFEKAKARLPRVEETVRRRYEELYALEKENCKSIDLACEPFAKMLEEVAAALLGDKADALKLGVAYNIGKTVYLMDALDDIDEDFGRRRYNPLIAAFGNYVSRRQFIDDNRDDLSFILNSAANRAITDFNGIGFTQSLNLMRNILYKGVREKIRELLSSKKKLDRPKI